MHKVASETPSLASSLTPAVPDSGGGLSFQVERFADIMAELPPLFYEHWQEVAVDRDRITLEPDFAKYVQMEQAGILAVQTVRADGELVGYFFTAILPLLHYKSWMAGVTDIYFIRPLYRGQGWRFFRFVIQDLKSRGVQKHFTMAKLHMDPRIGLLWQRMGYKPVETWFSKILE